MIAKGMSNQQAKIYYQKLVFERMIEDIPSFIEKEIQKIKEQIKRDADATAKDDTYTVYDTYGDYESKSWHTEEIKVPIADDIARSDSRNGYTDILEKIPHYFYHSMVVMLYSFAESTMKVISEENHQCKKNNKKNSNSQFGKCFNKIKNQYPLIRSISINDYWQDYDVFRKIRNEITHEGEVCNPTDEPTQEFLLNNLHSIYSLLKEIYNKIENRNNHPI